MPDHERLPLRFAIYGRMSTEDQVASPEVQEGEARRWIASCGGSVLDEHIFVDEARSRAEFKKRPKLLRLMEGAKRGEFDAVVVRDETRLGGDMVRTGLIIQDLVDAEVRLFYYYTSEEVRFDSPVQKMIVAVKNFASELERAKVSERTHENLLVKVRLGLNVGGKVYGYDNRQYFETGKDGKKRKVRTEYEINLEQAEVVRRIFRMYADGVGLKRIARALNAAKVPSPKVGRRGTGSWSPSSLRAMLLNDRYLGAIPWNRRRKGYRSGTRHVSIRAVGDWMLVPAPHLRIIDDDLWIAAQAKRPGRRLGLNGDGPRRGRPPRHLLSGLMRCGVCGGPMQAANSRQRGEFVKAYTCSWHRTRGPEVCANSRHRPLAEVNSEVGAWIVGQLRSADVLDELMRRVREGLQNSMRKVERETPGNEKEAARLRAELRNLSDAIATGGGEMPSLLAAMRERQVTLDGLEADLRTQVAAGNAESIRLHDLERRIRDGLDDLARALANRPAEARPFMEGLFPRGLAAFPMEDGGLKRLRIEGEAHFAGAITKWVSPAGFEPAYSA